MSYLFIATAVWHSLAAYFFLIQPTRTLRSFTVGEPIAPIAKDLIQFLGAINIGYIILSAWGACQTSPFLIGNAVLSVANGSQFLMDLSAHRHDRWGKKLIGITIVDGFFMVAHGLALIYLTQYQRP